MTRMDENEPELPACPSLIPDLHEEAPVVEAAQRGQGRHAAAWDDAFHQLSRWHLGGE